MRTRNSSWTWRNPSLALIFMPCLCLASSCTTASVPTLQASQEILPASRTGYYQVDKRWLEAERRRCNVQVDQFDDPVYATADPQRAEVSKGLWEKILNGCARYKKP